MGVGNTTPRCNTNFLTSILTEQIIIDSGVLGISLKSSLVCVRDNVEGIDTEKSGRSDEILRRIEEGVKGTNPAPLQPESIFREINAIERALIYTSSHAIF